MEKFFLTGIGYDLYIQPDKYTACLTEVRSIVGGGGTGQREVVDRSGVTNAAAGKPHSSGNRAAGVVLRWRRGAGTSRTRLSLIARLGVSENGPGEPP